MNSSHHLLDELIGREGFSQLKVTELCKPGPLVDIVTEKVNSLDSLNFSEQELEKDVRILIGLLRETLSRRYMHLSVLAFAHILVALDHFVRVKDATPDTHLGGYADDLAIVQGVLREFEREISDYKAWKQRMEEAEP
jgi:uncharacterized membrane protein YkvA (DUF1232 family)